MTCILRWLLALLALAAVSAPVAAQRVETPPGRLWRMEPNGDAVQTDLGLALPARWRDFERAGFTSTRPDGASVMTWYERADGPIRMRILVQLRVDVRGISMPGADGIDRNWPLLENAFVSDYADRMQSEPEQLVEQRIPWGAGTQPNAKMQLLRFRLTEGAEIQGLWYRNIGLWAIVVIVSGPEARRADVEATGQAVMSGMQWPGAPFSAELRAITPDFLRNLQDCGEIDRQGTGQAVDSGQVIAALIGMVLGANFVDTARNIPHPALQPEAYCRIETLRAGNHEMIALGRRGDLAGYPAVRYAFYIPDRVTLFQFESLFDIASVPADQRRGISRLVWLTGSNLRKVAAMRVFTDWPSYEQARAMAIETATVDAVPVVELNQAPGQLLVRVLNTGDAPPANAPAQPQGE